MQFIHKEFGPMVLGHLSLYNQAWVTMGRWNSRAIQWEDWTVGQCRAAGQMYNWFSISAFLPTF